MAVRAKNLEVRQTVVEMVPVNVMNLEGERFSVPLPSVAAFLATVFL
jgi:hypothetical protein